MTSMGRHALRYGLGALRGLGLRLNELTQMSPLSVATLKRYTRTADRRFGPTAPSLGKLTAEHKEALTLIWVHGIAADRPIGPPVPQRAFLDFFCAVCLTRVSPAGAARGGPPRAPCARIPHPRDVAPRDLVDAVTLGLHACENGVPVCASSAARFAAVLIALRVAPWDAYRFVTSEVAPSRWWVRTCLGCDRRVTTEAVSARFCPACRTWAARAAAGG